MATIENCDKTHTYQLQCVNIYLPCSWYQQASIGMVYEKQYMVQSTNCRHS